MARKFILITLTLFLAACTGKNEDVATKEKAAPIDIKKSVSGVEKTSDLKKSSISEPLAKLIFK